MFRGFRRMFCSFLSMIQYLAWLSSSELNSPALHRHMMFSERKACSYCCLSLDRCFDGMDSSWFCTVLCRMSWFWDGSSPFTDSWTWSWRGWWWSTASTERIGSFYSDRTVTVCVRWFHHVVCFALDGWFCTFRLNLHAWLNQNLWKSAAQANIWVDIFVCIFIHQLFLSYWPV